MSTNSQSIITYDFREHVLNKPDYYGSTTTSIVNQQLTCPKLLELNQSQSTSGESIQPVSESQSIQLEFKSVSLNQMIMKMFDELFTNCLDNIERSRKSKIRMTTIKISIDQNSFSILNDGLSIPIELNQELNSYLPEIAFSHERSSGNYVEQQLTSNGTYGIGVKLVNVFSKQFEIDIVNNGERYQQTFKNNMSEINPPVITKSKSSNYVKVVVHPDFSKLDVDSISSDTIDVIKFRILTGLMNHPEIKLEFNSKNIRLFSFNELSKSILTSIGLVDQSQIITFDSRQHEIQLSYSTIHQSSNLKPFIISFVNDILTIDGGIHVNMFFDALLNQVKSKLKSTHQSESISKMKLKSNSILIINQHILNPKFNGNVKSQLQSFSPSSLDEIVEDRINKFCIEVVNETNLIQLLTNDNVKSLDRKNDRVKIVFDKLRDANMVNSDPLKCTLFVTEGDSATGMIKTAAFHNLGCDYYGYYTLRGKPLNVKKCSIEKTNENDVINNLIVSLGLRFNQDYTNDLSGLRYGKVVMVKDADTDGSAIMLLIYNVFQTYFKSLIKNHDYFYEFITPQIQLTVEINDQDLNRVKLDGIGFQMLSRQQSTSQLKSQLSSTNVVKLHFNNTPEYNRFIQKYISKSTLESTTQSTRSTSVKIIQRPDYFKGLAAVGDDDSMFFWNQENYPKNLIKVVYDKHCDHSMMIGFGSKFENERKKLVLSVNDNTFLKRDPIHGNNLTDYIHLDYSLYCLESCERDIPNLTDGLKPVQRKLLYSLLHRTNDLHDNSFHKVFMIAAEASNFAFYHHGSSSIEEACCNMMQIFIGSNNLNIIQGKGSIGTRSMLGKDHGATRYISCRLNPIMNYIFMRDDNELLKHNIIEEEIAEPIEYYPIIPLILINGCRGIATGYSTFIPKYSVKDCIEIIKHKLTERHLPQCHLSNSILSISEREESNQLLTPHYNNFKGSIRKCRNGFETIGIQKYIDPSRQRRDRIKSDKFWKVKKTFNTNHNELNYNFAFIWISELPIDSNLESIKSELNEMIKHQNDSKSNPFKVVSYQDNSKEGTSVSEEQIELIIKVVNDGHLKINDVLNVVPNKSKLSLSNMYLWNDGHLQKFKSIDEILNTFIEKRLNKYEERRQSIIKRLQFESMILKNKFRFIDDILSKRFDIRSKSKNEVEKYLIENGFDKSNQLLSGQSTTSSSTQNGFSYLTQLPIHYFVKEMFIKLKTENEMKLKELNRIQSTSPNQLWLDDIEKLETVLRNLNQK